MNKPSPETDEEFESLLGYLKQTRGFDFTGYKRSSLMRRVHRRMSQIGIENYADYVDQLQVNSEEFVTLFNTILINVTGFFRDREAWDYIRDEVIPALLAERSPEEPIRVWSAGCAAGQEAYSLAMLFTEALGVEEFRRRVKIYATDIDDEALSLARHAAYTPAEIEGLTEEQLKRYFELQGSRYCFRKNLRHSVIFGRNDLVQDAPISRIDLLVCRNTLMYFNADTQTKVLERLHFALAPQGLLFLGRAEMLLSQAQMFEPVDLKRRMFRKASGTSASYLNFVSRPSAQHRAHEIAGMDLLRKNAFSTSPVAQIVLTEDETIALVNRQAELAFGVSDRDIGRPLRDLDISYQPVALRGYVEQVRLERRSLRIKDVQWRRAGETVWYEVHVNPLSGTENTFLGVSVVFHDVTWVRQLMAELERTNRQLESAYEELQSTNEELETMNEELQSANDELQTINDTLRERSLDLDEVNEFLESVLVSIRAGIVVIDKEMQIKAWNRGAEDLWGVRREEAEGAHLLNLDIGLSVTELRPMVREALGDPDYHTSLTVDAINRRGKKAVVRLVFSALRGADGNAQGALLVMEELPE